MQKTSDPDTLLSRACAKFCIWTIIVVGLVSLAAFGYGIASHPNHPTGTVVTYDDGGSSDCGVDGGCP